jgi:hypothetical protein
MDSCLLIGFGWLGVISLCLCFFITDLIEQYVYLQLHVFTLDIEKITEIYEFMI